MAEVMRELKDGLCSMWEQAMGQVSLLLLAAVMAGL